MLRDKDFLLLLPKAFNLGFFYIDIGEVTTTYLTKI